MHEPPGRDILERWRERAPKGREDVGYGVCEDWRMFAEGAAGLSPAWGHCQTPSLQGRIFMSGGVR